MLGAVALGAEGAGTTMESVVTALTTSFTSVSGSIMDVIGKILPIALPVVGAVIVVSVGIKIFKSLVKK